ncbi:MAG TPA: hypothetical protein VJ860_18535, partial [Polyangia bacterium]|nr:hypothetical protein [Polyangia bacterium]
SQALCASDSHNFTTLQYICNTTWPVSWHAKKARGAVETGSCKLQAHCGSLRTCACEPCRGKLTFVRDTSPKANARYFEFLRRAGPERRLAICLGLTRATRELAGAGIKQSHPHRVLSDDEIRQKLAERLYGVEVARRVFAGRAP